MPESLLQDLDRSLSRISLLLQQARNANPLCVAETIRPMKTPKRSTKTGLSPMRSITPGTSPLPQEPSSSKTFAQLKVRNAVSRIQASSNVVSRIQATLEGARRSSKSKEGEVDGSGELRNGGIYQTLNVFQRLQQPKKKHCVELVELSPAVSKILEMTQPMKPKSHSQITVTRPKESESRDTVKEKSEPREKVKEKSEPRETVKEKLEPRAKVKVQQLLSNVVPFWKRLSQTKLPIQATAQPDSLGEKRKKCQEKMHLATVERLYQQQKLREERIEQKRMEMEIKEAEGIQAHRIAMMKHINKIRLLGSTSELWQVSHHRDPYIIPAAGDMERTKTPELSNLFEGSETGADGHQTRLKQRPTPALAQPILISHQKVPLELNEVKAPKPLKKTSLADILERCDILEEPSSTTEQANEHTLVATRIEPVEKTRPKPIINRLQLEKLKKPGLRR